MMKFLKQQRAKNLLMRSRKEISVKLVMNGAFITGANAEINANSDKLNECADREVAWLVDCLVKYVFDGIEEFRHLYIGARLKMAYEHGSSALDYNNRIVEFMGRDKAAFISAIPTNDTEIRDAVTEFFNEIIFEYKAPIVQELDVLFIGDCLFLDVYSFLSGMLKRHGTVISPHFIATKSNFETHKHLKSLQDRKFDVIFYSPITYTFNPNFSSLLNYRNVFMGGFEHAESLAGIFSQITSTIDILTNIFECPVFVHNTACLQRDVSYARGVVTALLEMRLRSSSKKFINSHLIKYIETSNLRKYRQLFLFDELEITKKNNSFTSAKYFYWSPLQHPTRFSVVVADKYNCIINVLANLNGRKLLVCDLDNTLWDGVIGEGPVSHYNDRQEILLRLKSKGVVLAINSKNDPININWTGGLLSENDFVYQDINWEPKIKAFPKMEAMLNIKMKDFVFIDDRSDELDLVNSTFPSVQCLNATDPNSWRLLELWEHMLDDSGGMDRSKIYKEKEIRDDFLNTIEVNKDNEADMFNQLGLILSLREVKQSEIKRAVELINRTNQFNMRASRTNFNEMKNWLHRDECTVLQASMLDKFGDMGVISIIVFERQGANIEILVFVLSCRVFGYGVETAILNEIKRRALLQEAQSIVGKHTETAYNSPCRMVYPNEKFEKKDSDWVFPVSSENEIHDPQWIAINIGAAPDD